MPNDRRRSLLPLGAMLTCAVSGSTLAADYSITVSNLTRGIHFTPLLPAATVGWTVARVVFQAEKRAPEEVTDLIVELRLPDSGVAPSDTVLGTATIDDTDLTANMLWTQADFGIGGLPIGPGLCVVFRAAPDENPARIGYDKKNSPVPDGLIKGPVWGSVSDDQSLLILRLNRRMSWKEVALVLDDDVDGTDEDELNRAAAKCRQRFQTVKRKMHELAEASGLTEVD